MIDRVYIPEHFMSSHDVGAQIRGAKLNLQTAHVGNLINAQKEYQGGVYER